MTAPSAIRAVVDEMLVASANHDWARARRASKKLRSMSDAGQRRREITRWLQLNGDAYPNMAGWDQVTIQPQEQQTYCGRRKWTPPVAGLWGWR